MFEHIIIFGMNFKELFLICVLILLLIFLGVFLTSLYNNRENINFYSLVVRENGRISKVGTAFVFILTLLIYQVISETEVSFYLVELLGIIFAAELGTKYVDGKLTQSNIDTIRNNLSNIDKSKTSSSAKNIDNIDFDNL
jgi:hypothetical protein